MKTSIVCVAVFVLFMAARSAPAQQWQLPDYGRNTVAKPFNFMVGVPGRSFSVAELEAAGVRRISLAASLYRAAMGGLVAAARETKEKGTFVYVDTGLPFAELNGYMSA
jgi:2-methylisocitrate lyase-like PEP mutase family enzyme